MPCLLTFLTKRKKMSVFSLPIPQMYEKKIRILFRARKEKCPSCCRQLQFHSVKDTFADIDNSVDENFY